MAVDEQPPSAAAKQPDAAFPPDPRALLRLEQGGTGLWVRFDEPEEWIETRDPGVVTGRLARVEERARDGRFAVGCVAYEAAAAFDDALDVPRGPEGGATPPLLVFAIFRRATVVADPIPPFSTPGRPLVQAAELVDVTTYRGAIRAIRDHIANGDVYQVNFTFPLRVSASSSAGLGDQIFRQLCRSQGSAFASRLQGPGLDVACGSPELFFEREGDRITCRPMKGTAPRGRFLEEDDELAEALRASPKERAENLMIVDMMRNDLGRIARSGSVTVERLFEVERLPTLHQMTSTVTARTDASLAEIFGALFPCASITGAPKSSAMRIIAELEQQPRGIYTGAAGVVLPGSPAELGWAGAAPGAVFQSQPQPATSAPYARFAVAIRTAWRGRCEAGQNAYRYGIGSGVVWDSRADAELAETRSKALGLGLERPSFELLETMALRSVTRTKARPGIERVRLWPEHRRRLLDSAAYFAFRLDIESLEKQLGTLCDRAAPEPQRVRLRVAVDGSVQLEIEPLPRRSSPPWRLAICDRPVDTEDPFLFHKTTQRALYTERLDATRARRPDIDDALLQNERGALTETTIANLLLPPEQPGGPWRTPPRTAGLLAGTLRADLLRRGRIIEADLFVEDLRDAGRILLINSVRGVFPAILADP